jgi:hypothetical protein
MKKQKVTDIFFYRWRYVFGYTLLALLYVGAIIISALHIPGGLSQAEIDMVNTTNHLNFSIEGIAVTNLPFHLAAPRLHKLLFYSCSNLRIKATHRHLSRSTQMSSGRFLRGRAIGLMNALIALRIWDCGVKPRRHIFQPYAVQLQVDYQNHQLKQLELLVKCRLTWL